MSYRQRCGNLGPTAVVASGNQDAGPVAQRLFHALQLFSGSPASATTAKAGSPAFPVMRSLARRFIGIMRSRQADPLRTWIRYATSTDLAPNVRFAHTLNRNFDATKSASKKPKSKGQAAGQINRLITLKRAIYGWDGQELLRTRMLSLCHTD